MNTHATNLLTQLIDRLYNATPTPDLHAFQMIAAELKGAMQADTPPSEPTPDGWVENTGVMPDGDIESVTYRNGSVFNNTNKHLHRWNFANSGEHPEVDITHYRPA